MNRWSPRVTVACIIPKNEHFLMVEERIDGKAVFNQPAGHLETGESLLQAAEREVMEETAWKIELCALIGCYLWQQHEDVSYLRFCFLGDPLERLPKKIDPVISATHWMSYDDIIAKKDDLRSPLVLRCIQDYLAGNAFPLTVAQTIE